MKAPWKVLLLLKIKENKIIFVIQTRPLMHTPFAGLGCVRLEPSLVEFIAIGDENHYTWIHW